MLPASGMILGGYEFEMRVEEEDRQEAWELENVVPEHGGNA